MATTTCPGCPYRSDPEWRHMRDHRPEEWADAVEFDAAIRIGIPGVNGEAYLHRSCVPLGEVDLLTAEQRGQTTLWSLFGNECEGMCGV